VITCTKCSRQNEDHFRFCLGCGANLEDQRAAMTVPAGEPAWPSNCPTCSAPVQPGQRFCGTCGSKVEPVVAAAHAASVAHVPSITSPPAPAPAAVAPVAAAPIAVPGGSPIGQLVMIMPDGSSGDAFPLMAGDNVIGRAHPAAVFSRDPHLSPHHARFMMAPGAGRVIDLNSHNGVYFRLRERTEINDGDMLRVGHEVLRFTVLANAKPAMATPADGTHLSGSPTAGAWARLERISAPDEASYSFMLRGTEQVLGRERGDILFRDDGYVSGRHARIFTEGGRFYVEDLQSSNGTFLRIRGERNVTNGDLLLLGQQPFRIVLN
jgi:pSer/pThr/pTyr-binding forkhead associated (FHA) protein